MTEQERFKLVFFLLSVPSVCHPPHTSSFSYSFPDVLLQVKVGFPDKEAHAGAAVQLQLQAAPGSVCAVQAVDENMLFTRADHELTSRMVSVCAARQKLGSDG